MTNHTLELIKEYPRDSRVLISGCGTGLTAFFLLENGFTDVVGTDLLPETIEIARSLNERFYCGRAQFFTDDGFHPVTTGEFNIIAALHWVFSAWDGNYGNDPVSDPYDEEVRREKLTQFLQAYRNMLAPDGVVIVELIDSICDVRLEMDHPLGLTDVYRVRHSVKTVEAVGKECGLSIRDQYLSYTYGHQARMTYWLQRDR